MLKLTKRTEYALIALVHLADREGSADGPFVSAREVGERYPVPRRLLAEVLKDLCKAELVSSQRGAGGGYALARPAERISLGEVIAALEGRPGLTGCETTGRAQGEPCEVEPVCPIKSPMQRVRHSLWDLMQRTSLADMAFGGPRGRTAAGEDRGASHSARAPGETAPAQGPRAPRLYALHPGISKPATPPNTAPIAAHP